LKLLLYVCISVIFISLLAGYIKSQYYDVVEGYQEKLERLAYNIDFYLSGRLLALQVLADQRDIINLDPESIRPHLIQLSSKFNLANAAVFDYDGHIVISLDANHPSFVNDFDSFNVARQGIATISNRIIRKGIDKLFISLRTPIYSPQGECKGVIAAGVSNIDIERIITSETLGAQYNLLVLDSKGQVIYHPRLREILDNEECTLMTRLYTADSGNIKAFSPLDKVEKLFVFQKINNTGWRLALAIPIADLYQETAWRVSGEAFAFVSLLIIAGLIYRLFLQEKKFQNNIEMQRTERLACVNQLAAGIAHEIRNPLTAIKGFVQYASIKKDPEILARYLEVVLEEINRIEKLIHEFRLLAKPSTTPDYAQVDLNQTVKDVVMLMEGEALAKNIILAHQESPCIPVKADSDQLKQVWINLLRNAIEAVAAGGHILIKVIRDKQDACVIIQDDGPGIAAGHIAKLGTLFFTTKTNGTGLGLPICYTIISNHKGSIAVSSEQGQGTIFRVKLPLTAEV
jgi:signal transduction histidine kinase